MKEKDATEGSEQTVPPPKLLEAFGRRTKESLMGIDNDSMALLNSNGYTTAVATQQQWLHNSSGYTVAVAAT